MTSKKNTIVNGLNSRGDIDLNSHNIINMKNPVDPGDAATKKYVDNKTDTVYFTLICNFTYLIILTIFVTA